jgi:hypothetical protein
MPSWVEEDARSEALLDREGPEVWRDLKASIRQGVADYTRIYTPEGTVEVQSGSCLIHSESCIQVRTVPPLEESVVSFEVNFSPDRHKIICDEVHVEFSLAVKDHEITIQDRHGATVSLEDASKAVLKPLFSKLPHKKPNISL